MIPAILPTLVHQLLTAKPASPSQVAPGTFRTAAPSAGGAIARDFGHLTTDTLRLFGLDGAIGSQATPKAAAQAYGNSSALTR